MAAVVTNIVDRLADRVTGGAYSRMKEALPSIEATLALEDAGWARTNAVTGRDANDLSDEARADLVRRSRKYFIYDPLCKQAIRLFVSYCIGRGLSIQANGQESDTLPGGAQEADATPADSGEEGLASTEELQAFADNFWEHPDNAVVFSILGQHRSAEKVNIDGELFFVAFPGEDVTRIRTLMDCLEISQVITDPDDYSQPWYYLRRWKSVTGEVHTLLYPDISLYQGEGERVSDDYLPTLSDAVLEAYKIPRDTQLARTKDDSDYAFIKHIPLNTAGIRGYPLLTPALDWAKVQRGFLEDRATIAKAHARFAWKRTVNGPPSMVGNLPQGANAQNPAGPFGAGGVYPGMSYPAAATYSHNGGADWEPVNAQSGGQNAYVESRNFTLQFCRAVGIPEHYFADGSMGTRATSRTMERPVELMFTDFQTIFKSVYEELFVFALKVAGRPHDAHAVRVDAPKILSADTETMVNAYVSLLGVLPEFDIDETRLLMLNALMVDDPQDLLPKIAAKRKALDDYELELAQAMSGAQDAMDQTPDPATATPEKLSAHIGKQQSAFTKLVSVLAKNVTRATQFGQGEAGSPLEIRKPAPHGSRIASDPTRQR